MKKTIATVAIAAGMLATPAMAQAQNVAPGGFYVGALAGYEGLDVESGDASAVSYTHLTLPTTPYV